MKQVLPPMGRATGCPRRQGHEGLTSPRPRASPDAPHTTFSTKSDPGDNVWALVCRFSGELEETSYR